jgi:hypothetical protein
LVSAATCALSTRARARAESICTDEKILEQNYRYKMKYSPDYKVRVLPHSSCGSQVAAGQQGCEGPRPIKAALGRIVCAVLHHLLLPCPALHAGLRTLPLRAPQHTHMQGMDEEQALADFKARIHKVGAVLPVTPARRSRASSGVGWLWVTSTLTACE